MESKLMTSSLTTQWALFNITTSEDFSLLDARTLVDKGFGFRLQDLCIVPVSGSNQVTLTATDASTLTLRLPIDFSLLKNTLGLENAQLLVVCDAGLAQETALNRLLEGVWSYDLFGDAWPKAGLGLSVPGSVKILSDIDKYVFRLPLLAVRSTHGEIQISFVKDAAKVAAHLDQALRINSLPLFNSELVLSTEPFHALGSSADDNAQGQLTEFDIGVAVRDVLLISVSDATKGWDYFNAAMHPAAPEIIQFMVLDSASKRLLRVQFAESAPQLSRSWLIRTHMSDPPEGNFEATKFRFTQYSPWVPIQLSIVSGGEEPLVTARDHEMAAIALLPPWLQCGADASADFIWGQGARITVSIATNALEYSANSLLSEALPTIGRRIENKLVDRTALGSTISVEWLLRDTTRHGKQGIGNE